MTLPLKSLFLTLAILASLIGCTKKEWTEVDKFRFHVPPSSKSFEEILFDREHNGLFAETVALGAGGTKKFYLYDQFKGHHYPFAFFKLMDPKALEGRLDGELGSTILDRDRFFKVPRAVWGTIIFLSGLEAPGIFSELLTHLEDVYATHHPQALPGTFQEKIVSRIVPLNVEKLAILDMLTSNPDRHVLNVLVQQDREKVRLVPIDQDRAFPEIYTLNKLFGIDKSTQKNGLCPTASLFPKINCKFPPVWITPPLKAYLETPISQTSKDYIKALNIRNSIDTFQLHSANASQILTFEINAYLLKAGIKEGKTLAQIYSLMVEDGKLDDFLLKTVVPETVTQLKKKGYFASGLINNREKALEIFVSTYVKLLPGWIKS